MWRKYLVMAQITQDKFIWVAMFCCNIERVKPKIEMLMNVHSFLEKIALCLFFLMPRCEWWNISRERWRCSKAAFHCKCTFFLALCGRLIYSTRRIVNCMKIIESSANLWGFCLFVCLWNIVIMLCTPRKYSTSICHFRKWNIWFTAKMFAVLISNIHLNSKII